MNRVTLLDHISVIKAPRQNWKITDSLSDIIFIAIVELLAVQRAGKKLKFLETTS